MHGSTSNITHSVANALSKAKPSVAHLQGAHYVVTCFPGQMMAFLGKDAVALRKAEQDGGTRLSDFQSRYQISPNLTSGVLFHLARAVVGISFDGTTDVITNRFNKNRFKLQFTQEM
jgi:hypothetical protein